MRAWSSYRLSPCSILVSIMAALCYVWSSKNSLPVQGCYHWLIYLQTSSIPLARTSQSVLQLAVTRSKELPGLETDSMGASILGFLWWRLVNSGRRVSADYGIAIIKAGVSVLNLAGKYVDDI